ncbi:adenosylcobyric acid synthase (glutamine-hydrolysing) [Halomicrobium zhouii]|uniref:Probable cobyric acid synthase n=1 Tax=Halomicrobium zhouii TaxID=767519 RepID=A0A1I6L8F5_9EURY|nr:cobyric acid synthase [Halomicrobium zhouii]SFR99518.1 adenosylcobyric acid synthase (glutamine-hydrolysing) [Halomicrobium zhouii]
MTRTVLVAGTASHVGKSTVAAGLCRHLANEGRSVAPFKAQNMSNNARVVPRADGRAGDGSPDDESPDDESLDEDPWGEIGVSQYVQARAARIPATTDHNPVLLKPRGDGESQLIVDGRAAGHFAAGTYYDDHWDDALSAARAAHDRLAREHDVVVAEGAGSIAEINLHDRDLANVETARFSDADILLVADVERGGVFASLVGTLELMPDDLREQVVGCVITKFRGDRSILDPGVEQFEDRTGVPVLGVLPYDDPGLPEEDSVALPAADERSVRGAADGVPADRTVTVAVPRLPRISNATDLEPLAAEPGVRVAYVPLDGSLADVGADAVVIPGTKNTVDDLLELRDAGMHEELRRFDGPVVGLCGGYQMIGEEITNASLEGTGEDERVEGVGLLPITTRFDPEKTLEAVTRDISGVGPLAEADGEVSGYEIHAGETEVVGEVRRPFADEGAATDRVLGTYLHGLFENEVALDGFVERVFEVAGRERPDGDSVESDPYERAASLVEEYVDLSPILG